MSSLPSLSLVEFCQHALDLQGYLIVGTRTAYLVGDSILEPLSGFGETHEHFGLKVRAKATVEELDRQCELLGFDQCTSREWPFYYRVVAE